MVQEAWTRGNLATVSLGKDLKPDIESRGHLLSRVGFHVPHQCPLLSKGHVAFHALVGSCVAVDVHMDLEVALVVEAFSTALTHVLHLLRMGPDVIQQGGLMGKHLVADATSVRLFACVDALVNSEV